MRPLDVETPHGVARVHLQPAAGATRASCSGTERAAA